MKFLIKCGNHVITLFFSFVSGKIFENFTLNPPKLDTGSPPSQPPTPPSTPLSPKSNSDLSNKYTSTSVPNIPNLTITHNSSPNTSIPQNFLSSTQKIPLNLGTKPKATYTNGLQSTEFSSYGDSDLVGRKREESNGATDRLEQKTGQGTRVS